jgi:hypothetical protein
MSMEQEELEQVAEETTDNDMKQLRDAANRSKANAEAANAAQRENAFLKAGVDTDSNLGKLAMSGYEGEMNTEAIKAFMGSLGPAAGESTATEVVIGEEERQSTEIRTGLGTGVAPPTNTPPVTESPYDVGLREFQAAKAEGRTAEEASAFFFDNVFNAAVKGDKRVLIDGSHNL